MTAPGNMLHPRVLTVIRLGVSALFVAVVAVAVVRSGRELSFQVHGVWWLALGILPAAALVAGKGIKWQVVVRGLAPRVTFREAVRSYVAAIPYSLVTPGRVGEVARTMFLPYPNVHGMAGVGAVVLDKVTDLICLLWWIALGLWFFVDLPGLALAACAAALCLTPLRLWLGAGHRVIRRLGVWPAFQQKLEAAIVDLRALSRGRIVTAVGLGVVCFGIEWVQYWAFFNALAPTGVHVPFGEAVGIMAIVTLANVAQISFAGIGVREGLAALMLASTLPPASAATAAFAVFALDQALPGVVGLFAKPIVLKAEDSE